MSEQRKGYTGYRYSVAGKKLFIIKLTCYNEFINPKGLCNIISNDFFTTDCVVEEIRDANTGKRYKWIKGHAFQSFRYEDGQRIKGTSIYYCKTRSGLYLAYLYKNSLTGEICEKRNSLGLFQQEIVPGLLAVATSIVKYNLDDPEECFIELNALLLRAEKKLFPDEQRTLEEILHHDQLSLENVPPELKPNPNSTMEECIEDWKEFQNYCYNYTLFALKGDKK